MRPRVFFLEPLRHDSSHAEVYGEPVYLFEADESRPSIWSKDLCRQAVDRLQSSGFRPNIDYLMVAGALPALSQLLLRLGRVYDSLNMLLFNSSTREYDSVVFSQRAIECEPKL